MDLVGSSYVLVAYDGLICCCPFPRFIGAV